MPFPPSLLCGLRRSLKAIVARTHSQKQLSTVIEVAHSLANSFLFSKKSMYRLSALHGLNQKKEV